MNDSNIFTSQFRKTIFTASGKYNGLNADPLGIATGVSNNF